MAFKLRVFFRIPAPSRRPMLLSLLITCILALIATTLLFSLQPVIPIFYSLAQPGQYLARKEWILLFPIFSFLITVFHAVVLKMARTVEPMMLQLFAWTTVVFQTVLGIAMIRILLLVI